MYELLWVDRSSCSLQLGKRSDFYTKILKVIGILIERKRKKDSRLQSHCWGCTGSWSPPGLLQVKYNGKSFKAPALCPICEWSCLSKSFILRCWLFLCIELLVSCSIEHVPILYCTAEFCLFLVRLQQICLHRCHEPAVSGVRIVIHRRSFRSLRYLQKVSLKSNVFPS